DGRLHRRVHGETRSGAVRLDRRDVDDRATLRHVRYTRPHEMRDGGEVLADQRVLTLRVDAHEVRLEPTTGVVHQHVDAMVERSLDVVDERADLIFVTHAEHTGHHPLAETVDLLRHEGRPIRVAIAPRPRGTEVRE